MRCFKCKRKIRWVPRKDCWVDYEGRSCRCPNGGWHNP